MKFIALFLLVPFICSCKSAGVPGRTLKSVGRTFGFVSQNDTLPPAEPAKVALKALH